MERTFWRAEWVRPGTLVVKGLCSRHALRAAIEPWSDHCHSEAQCCHL